MFIIGKYIKDKAMMMLDSIPKNLRSHEIFRDFKIIVRNKILKELEYMEGNFSDSLMDEAEKYIKVLEKQGQKKQNKKI
jgi:hypothetical protein